MIRFNPRMRLDKHFNKLRYISLSLVLLILVIIPSLSVYQNFLLSHAYDLLNDEQQFFYDTMQILTGWLLSDPSKQLSLVKGSSWTAQFGNLSVSDPLAVLSFLFSSKSLNFSFIMSAAIPVLLSLIFGRYFCGWICPASLIYELNHNLSLLLKRAGFISNDLSLPVQLKYWILGLGLLASFIMGVSVFTLIYPPLLLGRELFYAIALSGFSSGALFFLLTLGFDFLFVQRGFCRYLCPGGAVYSLLGRHRIIRVQREVESCNNCTRCVAICEFGLNPMQDSFGQECTNCSACIAQCPTDSLYMTVKWKDQNYQGDGHLSAQYKSIENNTSENKAIDKNEESKK